MQNETQILDKIRIVVTEILEINPEDIIPSANIRDDLRADSLASAEIVMALEDAFNIAIPAIRKIIPTIKTIIPINLLIFL